MRIGIIGTGLMGVFHARRLHDQVSGATVFAVTHLDRVRTV